MNGTTRHAALSLLLGSALLAPGIRAVEPAREKIIGPGVGFTVSNSLLSFEVSHGSGSIGYVTFGDVVLYDGDLTWGFQVGDDVNTTAVLDGFGSSNGEGLVDDVFQTGDSVTVLGTYNGLPTLGGGVPKAPTPFVDVDFARVYSLHPTENAVHLETLLVNNDPGNPVTIRYFDSIDPDICTVDTFTDLTTAGPGAVPVALATSQISCGAAPQPPKGGGGGPVDPPGGVTVLMGTDDPNAVLSAGNPFGGVKAGTSDGYYNIYDGFGLNNVFDFPADDELAWGDPATSAIFEVTIPPGGCVSVALDFGFGADPPSATSAFLAGGAGAIPPPPVDCSLPGAPPVPPFVEGLYASGVSGSIYGVDASTAALSYRGTLPCNDFIDKGADVFPPVFYCGAMDIDYDNEAGVGYAISFPYALKGGPGSGFQGFLRFDMATGEPLGPPVELVYYADGSPLPVLAFMTDLEATSEGLIGAVKIEPSGKSDDKLIGTLFGDTLVGVIDPASGRVDLVADSGIPPELTVTGMAEDAVSGGLLLIVQGGPPEKGGTASWNDKIIFGEGTLLGFFDEGGSGPIQELPGLGYGLEFGADGNLYYSALSFEAEESDLFLLELQVTKQAPGSDPFLATYIGSNNEFVTGLASVGTVPPPGTRSRLVIGNYPSGELFDLDTFDASISYLSTLDCDPPLKGGPDVPYCGLEDFDYDNETGTAYAISPSDAFIDLKSASRGRGQKGEDEFPPQAGVRFDLETGDFLSPPVPIQINAPSPPKGFPPGSVEFLGVLDLEIVEGTHVVSVVGFSDIDKIGIPGIPVSALGTLNPDTGVVTVAPDAVVFGEEWITGIAYDGEGTLYLITLPTFSPDGGDKGDFEETALYLVVGNSVEFIDYLPGIGYGLEFDEYGALYYATDVGPFSEGELYRIELLEGPFKCKDKACTSLEAISHYVGSNGLTIGGLALVLGGDDEQPPVTPDSCICPATIASLDSSDGRLEDSPAMHNRDRGGASVALCGDTAMVGAPAADPAPGIGKEVATVAAAGSVYVYDYDGASTMPLQQVLTANDLESGDYFGHSVSLSGNVAVVGAPFHEDVPTAPSTGMAYVFERQIAKGGSPVWVQTARLPASGAGVSDKYGWSVDNCGDVAIVGMPNDMPRRVGRAYIHRYMGPVTPKDSSWWTEEAELVPAAGDGYDEFGISVAIDGGIAVVGASGDDDFGSRSGAAYVYFYTPGVKGVTGTWGTERKIVGADIGTGDGFGTSVDICGDIIVVGAPNEDDGAINSGAVYVFKIFGPDTIVQIEKFKADVPGIAAKFGQAVAASCTDELLFKGSLATGSVFVAVGAPYDNTFISDGGSTYLFTTVNPILKGGGGGPGFLVGQYSATDPDSVDYMGTSVSLNGTTVMGGALMGDAIENNFEVGTGHVFPLGGLTTVPVK